MSVTALYSASAMIHAGRLYLPAKAHWLGEFTSELLGFPLARHDDQVDALSQLLLWVQDSDRFRPTPLAGPEEMPPHPSNLRYDLPQDPWGA